MPTRTAVAAAAMAHQWGFTRRPASRVNSTMIGSAATRVESHQWPSGSYTCVQFIRGSFRPRCDACGASFLGESYIFRNCESQVNKRRVFCGAVGGFRAVNGWRFVALGVFVVRGVVLKG